MYYLNSRYYNPEWGRFINFDNYGGQVGEILSHNGYAYCMNNPVNMVDENGNMAISGTVAGVAVLLLGVATILSIPQERYEEAANAVTNAITSVGNYIDQQLRKDEERNNTVYRLRNDNSGQIVYVGRTTNLKARAEQHRKTKPGNTLEIIASNLTRKEARGMEQIYMIEYNTRSFLNKINGISPNNKKIKIYMEAGRQIINYLGNNVSNEALYWTGK